MRHEPPVARRGRVYRFRLDSPQKDSPTSGKSLIDTPRKLAGMQPVNRLSLRDETPRLPRLPNNH